MAFCHRACHFNSIWLWSYGFSGIASLSFPDCGGVRLGAIGCARMRRNPALPMCPSPMFACRSRCARRVGFVWLACMGFTLSIASRLLSERRCRAMRIWTCASRCAAYHRSEARRSCGAVWGELQSQLRFGRRSRSTRLTCAGPHGMYARKSNWAFPEWPTIPLERIYCRKKARLSGVIPLRIYQRIVLELIERL